MTMPYETVRDQLLDAALEHVPFDGWSSTCFDAAITDTGLDRTVAEAACPRGAVDLALAFHQRGDAIMLKRLEETDLNALKYRDRVALAVRYRLEAVSGPNEREAVRRGLTLFALPHLAAEGARAVWNTCDQIWTALGDTSDDFNWYSKRAILSGVYSSTLLFWMGDDSDGNSASWTFLARRIDDVMLIEKVKAQVNGNPLLKPLLIGPNWLSKQIRAPVRAPRVDLPGMLRPRP
ncbi:COQ9 family protein [Ruegeria sp. 2205SS24-7]|uniref:COQ9 family protein n=1 Tax=Ruegeria discodermiae TaxID=3064389 RepID=UPI0027426AE9|nr:COQ9 family protein [Ruegeria sp. 2205SS24-7]MDP5218038.1 COQ9 family protein [Ruegeria sp. 2205SS24-7]